MVAFVIRTCLFWCSSWANLAQRQVNLILGGGAQKSRFSPNLNHSWIRQKVFSLPHTFSSSFNFLRQRKWVNVIPFLMVEQANLLTPPIVVWLSDGREAGDKRKVQRERDLFDFLHVPALLLLGDRLYLQLDYPDVCSSPSLGIQSPRLSWHLLSPGSALIRCSGKFPRL